MLHPGRSKLKVIPYNDKASDGIIILSFCLDFCHKWWHERNHGVVCRLSRWIHCLPISFWQWLLACLCLSASGATESLLRRMICKKNECFGCAISSQELVGDVTISSSVKVVPKMMASSDEIVPMMVWFQPLQTDRRGSLSNSNTPYKISASWGKPSLQNKWLLVSAYSWWSIRRVPFVSSNQRWREQLRAIPKFRKIAQWIKRSQRNCCGLSSPWADCFVLDTYQK